LIPPEYTDEEILNSIVIAIAMMAANEVYCVAIQSAGALEALGQILQNYPTNEVICSFLPSFPVAVILKLILNLSI